MQRLINFIRHYVDVAAHLTLLDERWLYGQWEVEHLRRFFQFAGVDCVFDVGANEGQYGNRLRKKCGYKGLIVSFEPIPSAAAKLRNVAKRDPLWVVEQLAIADLDGEREFNVMEAPMFSSLSQPRYDKATGFEEMNSVKERLTVRAETLTTALQRVQANHRVRRPFLKLDTQGYDVTIVSNTGPTLLEFVGFQSELSVKPLYRDSVDFREALKLYESRGFELSAIVPNNAGHFPVLVECDCIMVRRDLVRAGGGLSNLPD